MPGTWLGPATWDLLRIYLGPGQDLHGPGCDLAGTLLGCALGCVFWYRGRDWPNSMSPGRPWSLTLRPGWDLLRLAWDLPGTCYMGPGRSCLGPAWELTGVCLGLGLAPRLPRGCLGFTQDLLRPSQDLCCGLGWGGAQVGFALGRALGSGAQLHPGIQGRRRETSPRNGCLR